MSKSTNQNSANKSSMVNFIIVVIIIAFVCAGVYATYGKISEGLEEKAITSGEKEATVEYLAKQAGMSVEDYLAQYGLEIGDTIKNDTTETDMLDNMTLENYLKYTGDSQTVDEVLEGTGLTEKATKDTLWKDFLPMVPVVSVIGEESFNQIKEQLGLGDEVTTDMPYGDFQKLIEEKAQTEETASEEAASDEAPAEETQAEEAPAAE